MTDIAPELLEKLQKSFNGNLAADKKAATLLGKIEAGNGNYVIAGDYAERVGESLAESFRKNLSSEVLPDGKMYWNIAKRIIEPLLREVYDTASVAAATVQKSLNTKAGIGLNAVKVAYDSEAVKGIMDKVCSYDQYDDAAWVLRDAPVSFARSVVDQTLKANADFQGKSGKSIKIVRRAGYKCCQWCADLEGTYEYPEIPEDVFRRHDNCQCAVDYDPGTGRVQNVHTKEWRDADERDRIEERKRFGLNNAYDSTPRKIESSIACEEASYPPKQVEVNKLSVDAEHINVKHNVTAEEALSYIENAVFSITRWGGTFEDYFGYDGAAYVNMATEEIRTAFKADEFSENIKKILEDIKNGQ